MVTIKSLENSQNILFSKFFSKNELVKSWIERKILYHTIWHGTKSNNSFCLKPEYDYRTVIPGILMDRFSIRNKAFEIKYREAISGDGQEWTRITNLNSSSLLALLFFYPVSSDNPLRINDYLFSKSYFEVKTHVFYDSESNMDVVLRGVDSDNNPVVLFLECKFSEYLNCGSYYGISNKYEEEYNKLNLLDDEEPIKGVHCKKEGDTISLCPKDNKLIYCAGIKQMLSHYIGVKNYAINRANALAEHISFVPDNTETVLLGEVLFDFGPSLQNSNNKYQNYFDAYKSLAEIINRSDVSVKMIDNLLTYQQIINDNPNYHIDKNVKLFYQF